MLCYLYFGTLLTGLSKSVQGAMKKIKVCMFFFWYHMELLLLLLLLVALFNTCASRDKFKKYYNFYKLVQGFSVVYFDQRMGLRTQNAGRNFFSPASEASKGGSKFN